MRELPFFSVIGRTISFEVTNLFTLFRLTWLPLALLIAAQIGLAQLVLAQVGDVTFASVNGMLSFMWLLWTVLLLQGLALSVVAVQVHRLVLFGERRPNQYFVYPFGSTEFRYILMGVLSVLIVMLPVAIASYFYYAVRMSKLETAIAALLAAPTAPLLPGGAWVTFAAIAVGMVFIIWLVLRLSVWPAAVVANNKLWPGDAWRATRGNALALLGMFIVSAIVLVIAVVLVQAAVWSLAAPGELTAGMAQESKNPTLRQAVTGGLTPLLTPNAILLEFLTQFVTTTYNVALLSFAYKALKGLDAEGAIGDQAEDEDPTLHMKPMSAF